MYFFLIKQYTIMQMTVDIVNQTNFECNNDNFYYNL